MSLQIYNVIVFFVYNKKKSFLFDFMYIWKFMMKIFSNVYIYDFVFFIILFKIVSFFSEIFVWQKLFIEI